MQSVFAADLDGDGDQDVLAAASTDAGGGESDHPTWQANLDGKGTFGRVETLHSDGVRTGAVHAADLDGDSDVDIIAGWQDNGRISWYANIVGGTQVEVGPDGDAWVLDAASGIHHWTGSEWECCLGSRKILVSERTERFG